MLGNRLKAGAQWHEGFLGNHVYVEEAYKGEAASSARLVVAGAGCLLR